VSRQQAAAMRFLRKSGKMHIDDVDDGNDNNNNTTVEAKPDDDSDNTSSSAASLLVDQRILDADTTFGGQYSSSDNNGNNTAVVARPADGGSYIAPAVKVLDQRIRDARKTLLASTSEQEHAAAVRQKNKDDQQQRRTAAAAKAFVASICGTSATQLPSGASSTAVPFLKNDDDCGTSPLHAGGGPLKRQQAYTPPPLFPNPAPLYKPKSSTSRKNRSSSGTASNDTAANSGSSGSFPHTTIDQIAPDAAGYVADIVDELAKKLDKQISAQVSSSTMERNNQSAASSPSAPLLFPCDDSSAANMIYSERRGNNNNNSSSVLPCPLPSQKTLAASVSSTDAPSSTIGVGGCNSRGEHDDDRTAAAEVSVSNQPTHTSHDESFTDLAPRDNLRSDNVFLQRSSWSTNKRALG
jgi:hypothetical protein